MTLENSSKVREVLRKKLERVPFKRVIFSVGDLVRISGGKVVFQKGYESGWSNEIFKITRVSTTRKPVIYYVSSLDNEEIDGFFYTEELSKVNVGNASTDNLKIAKILDRKGRGKSKYVKVTWRGLPDSVTSWIPESSLKNKK